MPVLKVKAVAAGLRSAPDCKRRGRSIRRTYAFAGFLMGIGFVNRVAAKAEKADHHPDIDIRWNKVTLTLSTHSEGGITAKDFALARQCDLIFSRFAARGLSRT